MSMASRPGERLIEVDVGRDSVLCYQTLAQAPLPPEAVVVSIERGDEVIVPRGDVTFEAGDRLTVFTTPAGREPLLELLSTPPGAVRGSPEHRP